MPIRLQVVPAEETEQLVSVLQDADEGLERIRATLADTGHTSYAALDGEALIGAATMRWEAEESEIIYIAVAPERRGQGVGKAIIALLLEEARARRRGTRSVLVGTADASLENIAFYLKCGFRMDHVRRDYFDYIQPPIVENGILMRDMLVLRFVV
ncbi:MAG TPA: GNAT family N-acetyltransferase [Ktedonobacterales bacterium]